MTPLHTDDAVTLWHGDALEVLRELADESINCCVTSPPYFGLRDYGVDGQYGLEDSPAAYVDQLVDVFAEVRRILANDGTLWVNLGDSYSTHQRGSDEGWDKSRLSNPGTVQKMQFASMRQGRHLAFDRPNKSLMGMPWRLAFGLQDDGWILRNDVIWSKPNGMPESVTDRLANRHEHLFMLTKERRYWFDLDAIREPHTMEQRRRAEPYRYQAPGQPEHTSLHTPRTDAAPDGHPLGRNPGDVWAINTQPFPQAHFATMPPALAERCVLAGCKPGGVVLDPFSGSGTTGLAAGRHGRRYVGIDLNREYLELSLRTRLGQTALLDGGAA